MHDEQESRIDFEEVFRKNHLTVSAHDSIPVVISEYFI